MSAGNPATTFNGVAGTAYTLRIGNTILHALHITGKLRTNSGAACKKEIGHHDLFTNILPAHLPAELITGRLPLTVPWDDTAAACSTVGPC